MKTNWKKSKSTKVTGFLLGAFFTSTTVHASLAGDDMMRVSSHALANSNSVFASTREGRPSLSLFNPANAVFAVQPGRLFQVELNGVIADVDFETESNGQKGTFDGISIDLPGFGEVDMGTTIAAGNVGAAYRLNDRMVFTFVPNASLLGGYEKDTNDPFARFGTLASISGLEMPFTVGYQFNDKLSLGATLALTRWDLRYRAPIQPENAVLNIADGLLDLACGIGIGSVGNLYDACGGTISDGPLVNFDMDMSDDWVPSVRLGLIFEAADWLNVGVAYDSGQDIRFEGGYTMLPAGGVQDLLLGLEDTILGSAGVSVFGFTSDGIAGEGFAELSQPARLTFAGELEVTERLTVTAQATVKEGRNGFRLNFGQYTPALDVAYLIDPRLSGDELLAGYEGETEVDPAISVNYKLTPELDVTAGWRRIGNGVSSNYHFLGVPVGDATTISGGFSWEPSQLFGFNDVKVDAACAYYQSEQNIPARSSENTNDGSLFAQWEGDVKSTLKVPLCQAAVSVPF